MIDHDKPRRYVGDAERGEIEILTDPTDQAAAQEAARARLQAAGNPIEWAELGDVFRGEYLVVTRDPVRFPGGSLGTYVRVDWGEGREAGGVVIIPRLGEEIVLVKHFRHATRAWHWEFPRGFASSEMSLEESARKELSEEIGAVANDLKRLGQIHPDSGMTSSAVSVFLAEIDTVGPVNESEGICESRLIQPRELSDWIARGKINDGITLAAFSLIAPRFV